MSYQTWTYEAAGQGLGLFAVLHGRPCGWGMCLGCALPTAEGDPPLPTAFFRDLDAIFGAVTARGEGDRITEVVLSNNGSTFDRDAFPFSVVLYFCAVAPTLFPNLAKLCFETRAEVVKTEEVLMVRETLDEAGFTGAVELAVGVEVFDETTRNKVYRKGLRNETLDRLCRNLSHMGGSLRAYFMYRPMPGWDTAEADADITGGVRWLEALAARHGISITMHLNPTFVTAEDRLLSAFRDGAYRPPTLEEVETLLLALTAGGLPSLTRLHVGLSDEDLAVPGGSFEDAPGAAAVKARLARWNMTANPATLRPAVPA